MRLSLLSVATFWLHVQDAVAGPTSATSTGDSADKTVVVTATVSPTMVWTTPPGGQVTQKAYSQKFTAYFSELAVPLSGKIGLGFISGSVGSSRSYPLHTAADASSIYSELEATPGYNYTGPVRQRLNTNSLGHDIGEDWATVVAVAGASKWYGPTYSQQSMDLTGWKSDMNTAVGTLTGDDAPSATSTSASLTPTTTPGAVAANTLTPATTSTPTTLAPGVVPPTTTTTPTTLAPGVVPTTSTTTPGVPTTTPTPGVPTTTPVPGVPTTTPVPGVPTTTPVPGVPTTKTPAAVTTPAGAVTTTPVANKPAATTTNPVNAAVNQPNTVTTAIAKTTTAPAPVVGGADADTATVAKTTAAAAPANQPAANPAPANQPAANPAPANQPAANPAPAANPPANQPANQPAANPVANPAVANP